MILDIVCGILLAGSFYLGYSKGIIKTVFGILSIFIGLLVTLKFSYWMVSLLEKILDIDPRMTIILGFVATFILVLLGIRMIGNGLEKILETAHINFINQLAGGLSSALMTLIIFSSLIWFLNQIKVISPETKSSSITYHKQKKLPDQSKHVFASIKPFFSEFWEKTQEAMDKVDETNSKKNTPAE